MFYRKTSFRLDRPHPSPCKHQPCWLDMTIRLSFWSDRSLNLLHVNRDLHYVNDDLQFPGIWNHVFYVFSQSWILPQSRETEVMHAYALTILSSTYHRQVVLRSVGPTNAPCCLHSWSSRSPLHAAHWQCYGHWSPQAHHQPSRAQDGVVWIKLS